MFRRSQDFVGSPETIAKEIERWFVGRAADGFILRVTRPRDFALFREKVVPILQARGLFRTEYAHDEAARAAPSTGITLLARRVRLGPTPRASRAFSDLR